MTYFCAREYKLQSSVSTCLTNWSKRSCCSKTWPSHPNTIERPNEQESQNVHHQSCRKEINASRYKKACGVGPLVLSNLCIMSCIIISCRHHCICLPCSLHGAFSTSNVWDEACWWRLGTGRWRPDGGGVLQAVMAPSCARDQCFSVGLIKCVHCRRKCVHCKQCRLSYLFGRIYSAWWLISVTSYQWNPRSWSDKPVTFCAAQAVQWKEIDNNTGGMNPHHNKFSLQ